MSSDIQKKLLRVIENREFERVGSNETISTNARVVSASNIDLEEEVYKKNFREDLYYRISAFPIEIPPLRDRKEDIPDLCKYFVKKFCASKCEEMEIDDSVMELLLGYNWPGNIRELRNSLKRSVLLANANGDKILPEHFTFRNGHKGCKVSSMHKLAEAIDRGDNFSLEEVESIFIKEKLDANNGNVSKVARMVGLNRSTLQKRLNTIAKNNGKIV